MPADLEHPSPPRDPSAPPGYAGPGTLLGAALRLRTAVLPTLWATWVAATADPGSEEPGGRPAGGPAADDASRDARLAAFDAAVADFAAEARASGASVTTVIRVLDVLAREIAADGAPPRSDALRQRAGRAAMVAFYRGQAAQAG